MRHLLNTLYVLSPRSYLHLDNENIAVRNEDGSEQKVPLRVLEQVVTFDSLGCSPYLMKACLDRGITLSFLDHGGHFLGRVDGAPVGNVLLRREQYRAADDERCAVIVRYLVRAKVHNQLVILKRFKREHPELADDSFRKGILLMEALLQQVKSLDDVSSLRGIEGKCADVYFSLFDRLILVKETEFRFSGRNRRPPRDQVNSLLSLFYTLLMRDVSGGCVAAGLDPYVGYLHVDRPGRESLALDLMEEFRAPLVDRFALKLINRRQVHESDFKAEVGGAVILRDEPRKRLIGLWQERKKAEITHPFLDEKVRIGLLPYLQAQLFARYIRGELDGYPAFLWR